MRKSQITNYPRVSLLHKPSIDPRFLSVFEAAGARAFVIRSLAADVLQENAFAYDGGASRQVFMLNVGNTRLITSIRKAQFHCRELFGVVVTACGLYQLGNADQ